DTWPDKLERDRGWNASQIAEAQRAVDDIREALSTEMRERDDEEE
ncbi:TPA: terminase, partial [Escherichia coli]